MAERPSEQANEKLDTVEIKALTPGSLTIGERRLVVEYPPDRAEIEQLEEEFERAAWSSEMAKDYARFMLKFLTLPIIKDGFDFDADGNPRDAQEAHAERRVWEHTLAGKDKLVLDLNMLGAGRFIEALNTFHAIKQFIGMPVMEERFQGPDGKIPEVIHQYIKNTGELDLTALAVAYRKSSITTKLEVLEAMRRLMKNRLRNLMAAYQVSTPTQAA